MPIQVIPARRTFGAEFGRALGGGLGQGLSEGISERYKKRDEKAKEKLEDEQREMEDEAAERMGIDLRGIRDPKVREKAFELMGQRENQENLERLRQEGKRALLKEKQNALSNIFSKDQGQQPSMGDQLSGRGQGMQEMPQGEGGMMAGEQGIDPAQITPEQIAQATAIDPAMGRTLQDLRKTALTENRERNKAKEKKSEALRQETLPIRKEISDRADAARRGIENKQKLMELIETGNIDDPTFAALAEELPMNLGKRMLSPETVEYKAGLIDEFGDLRKIFQGQTRVKEIELLEQKIADIYLTDEQKKAILNSRMSALKADLVREEAAAELEEEGKNYGLLNYRKEVEKRAKPKLESLFNRVLDEQKAIIKDAENQKKIPLDFNDPESKQIINQIYQEAGSDWKKAEKLAKQKGYTW